MSQQEKNRGDLKKPKPDDFFVLTPMGNRDKNETFAVKKSCQYLLRLISRRFVLDAELIDIICWIAGDTRDRIGVFLLSRLPEALREKYEEDLRYEPSGLQFYGETILKILNKAGSRRLVEAFYGFLLSCLRETENTPAGRGGSDLEKNIHRLKAAFTLSDLETELCLFSFIVDCYDPPEKYFDDHLHATRIHGRERLAGIMNEPVGRINAALLNLQNAVEALDLRYSGLRLTDEFKEILVNPHCDIIKKSHLKQIDKKNALPLEYHFLDSDAIDHILSLLAGKSATPSHILLYGPPGTGKTSFARGLAGLLADPVYDVIQSNAEENKGSHRRLTLTAAVNSLNRDRGAIFIVDEADNLLNTEMAWFSRGETQDKGWLNRLLDEPGLRIIWIVNHIHGVEESVLRRFAYSRHFAPFSRRQRTLLWENIVRRNRCKRFFSDEDLNRLAGEFPVSAGVIDLSVKKAREYGRHTRTEMLQAVRQGIRAHQTLSAGGRPPAEKNTGESDYSLEGLNISADISEVMFQAEQFDLYLKDRRGRNDYGFNLLLHGPPGSGKSAFARHLARHLDRELLDKRLSDLLDPYVGMTERHIRRAFDQAEAEGAVLLLDEADALLFPRQAAVRSWEITQTNELLMAMERFRGLLICTTNRLTGLDSAAIRRFNHKIGFDYLTPDGSRIFYHKMLAALVNTGPDEGSVSALRRLKRLTPGDFKIVRDRFAFYKPGRVSHAMLIDALEQEAAIKRIHQGEKPIGF